MTVIQRAGGALNLNPHFHMAVLDGVFVEKDGGISSPRGAWSSEVDASRFVTYAEGFSQPSVVYSLDARNGAFRKPLARISNARFVR